MIDILYRHIIFTLLIMLATQISDKRKEYQKVFI